MVSILYHAEILSQILSLNSSDYWLLKGSTYNLLQCILNPLFFFITLKPRVE